MGRVMDLHTQYIKVGLGGKTATVFSWLNDEWVILAVGEYIASTGGNLTSFSLAQAVTKYLQEEKMTGQEELETTLRNEHATKRSISERTAPSWLNKIGFVCQKVVRKGVCIYRWA